MGRVFRNIVAAVALLSVVATEGKRVSVPDSNFLIKRAPVPSPGNGFSYLGCFTDSTVLAVNLDLGIAAVDLNLGFNILANLGPVTSFLDNNTVQACINFCIAARYNYAGLSGDSCRCAGALTSSPNSSSNGCTTPCSGDSTQSCDAAPAGTSTTTRFSVYYTRPRPATPLLPGLVATVADVPSNYAYTGCFSGTFTDPAISVATVDVSGTLGVTAATCIAACNLHCGLQPATTVQWQRYCGYTRKHMS
ncbi:hypothetical protein E8E11_007584 [Didymella keratinophila]|nr:hypothetical protein E8E11_007584 [Didymella keratinophila]